MEKKKTIHEIDDEKLYSRQSFSYKGVVAKYV
jgi:hypothetical protein